MNFNDVWNSFDEDLSMSQRIRRHEKRSRNQADKVIRNLTRARERVLAELAAVEQKLAELRVR
jgi:hypothetical protein